MQLMKNPSQPFSYRLPFAGRGSLWGFAWSLGSGLFLSYLAYWDRKKEGPTK
jgi:hypothetical protein